MLKFLVVDDDLAKLYFMQIVINAYFADTECITASNGMEGLELALTHKPDLIVSNWFMPYMNGRELLQNLYHIDEMRKIPFLLESSCYYTTWLETDFSLSLEKHFIQCPFLPREFVRKIQILLAEYRKLYPIEEGGQRLFTR